MKNKLVLVIVITVFISMLTGCAEEQIKNADKTRRAKMTFKHYYERLLSV